MLKWIRRKRRDTEFSPPSIPDVSGVAQSMRMAEKAGPLEAGKALHVFEFDDLELRIDRDVVGMIRITANQGEDRRFSFSLRCQSHEWEKALETIFGFLASERSLRELPDNSLVKGHFYGFE